MDIFQANASTLPVTLLLLPDSSMMSLASVLDPMRAANRIAGRDLFRWRIASFDGGSATLTCGVAVAADLAFEAAISGGLLIVVAGFNQMRHAGPAQLRQIKRAARNFAAVGGVEAGAWILARGGLLDGRAATTHWEDLEEFGRQFPAIETRPDRFVIDGRWFTTGGASPTFDFMLHLIRRRYGYPLAIEVSSAFIYDGIHGPADSQPLLSLGRLEASEPRVAAAIHQMEQHIDDPLSIAQIAAQLQLSMRMLEYLFRQTLDMTPASYYRRLRLQAARRMVVDTRLKLQEIAIRTGFNSLSAFSRRFRQHYRQSPGECRRGALTESAPTGRSSI